MRCPGACLRSTSLWIEFSGPGVWPRDSAVMVRKRVNFSPCVRAYQSAMRSRTAPLRIAGAPSSISERLSSTRSSTSGRCASPTARRSFISVVSETFHPCPTAPSRCASGTRTSVKNTSLKCDAPDIWWIGRISMPGDRISRKKKVSPSCFGRFGSVRTTMMPKSDRCAPEVQIFCPLMIQSSPSRSARVRNAARSDPPAGSENNWHHTSSPRSAGLTWRSRCSGAA